MAGGVRGGEIEYMRASQPVPSVPHEPPAAERRLAAGDWTSRANLR